MDNCCPSLRRREEALTFPPPRPTMTAWALTSEYVGYTKRTPQLAGAHLMAGGFLYAWGGPLAQRQSARHLIGNVSVRFRGGLPLPIEEDTSLKTDQLGAAGWDLRSGTWLPAAQGTLYSYKGQGFLPGRTGLNPLRRNTLGDQGFRGEALLPPAGSRDLKGV